MALPQVTLDKIKPFTDSFSNDLNSQLHAVDAELAASGGVGSGAQIKRNQKVFFDLLEKLMAKMAEIIFNDLKNKIIPTKPAFTIVRADIENLVKHLIDQFRDRFAEKAAVLASFDNELKNRLDKQFVDIEQRFDAI